MNFSQFRILEIHYSHSRFKLAQPAIINDEGAFYRIDSTHIIDKFRIKSMEIKEEKLIIHLDSEDIILIVAFKNQ